MVRFAVKYDKKVLFWVFRVPNLSKNPPTQLVDELGGWVAGPSLCATFNNFQFKHDLNVFT
jgi:hypothetical protein